jgi:general secretion pathway protein H
MRGFTLVELLAVLAIIALSVLALSSNSKKSADTAKVRAFLIETAGVLVELRSQAMRSGIESYFGINSRQRYFETDQIRIAFPPGVELKAIIAGDSANGDTKPAIKFYPDGTSTGGKINLVFRRKSHEIRVNWLTGHVSLTSL